MSEITTVDIKVTALTKQKFNKHYDKIFTEVSKQALKNKHVRKVKAVRFKNVVLSDKQVQHFNVGDFSVNEEQKQIIVYAVEYLNHGNVLDSTTFKYNLDITDEWHWELTAGVTFSYTQQVGVPGSGTTKKVEVNLLASGGESHSKTNTFYWESTIGQEAHKKTTVNALLEQIAGNVPFECKIKVDGKVNCEVDLDIKTWKDQTRTFEIPLSRLLSETERTYITTGQITGAAGIRSFVEKHVEPLSSEEQQSASGSVEEKVVYDAKQDMFLIDSLE